MVGWSSSPGESLGQRVVHASFWVGLLNISDRGLKLGRVVVLASLLSPEDFGLLGIALLLISISERFLNLGIDSALIQRKEGNIDSYLDTAWVIKIGRGLGIFVIITIVAPVAAAFFNEPRVTPIIRAIAISILFKSLLNPAIIYFRKDLEFHKQFTYKISGALCNFVIAVVAAVYLQNVWALVYGILAGSFVQLVMSHRLSGRRPSLDFDYSRAKDLLGFGKWIWATTVVVFLATSGDDAFVGWYLGAGALGLYQVAFRLANAPASEVAGVISKVMFPAYSKLQDDTDRLRNAFLKTIRVTFLIGIPTAGGIILIAPEFTSAVLGEEWRPMITAMQIIAFGGILRAIVGTGGVLFKAYDLPNWSFFLNLVRAVVIFGTIWPLTEMMGIAGTAISISGGIAVTLPIWFYKSREITGLPIAKYGEAIGIPLLGTVIMAGPVIMVKNPDVLSLSLAVCTGVLVYSVVAYYTYSIVGFDPIRTIKDQYA